MNKEKIHIYKVRKPSRLAKMFCGQRGIVRNVNIDPDLAYEFLASASYANANCLPCLKACSSMNEKSFMQAKNRYEEVLKRGNGDA